MDRTSVFIVFFAVFAVVIFFLSWYSKKLITRESDYIIAGREVSLLVNIFGVASIGYAGTMLTLQPAFTIMYGMTKGLFLLGIPFAIMGYLSYGLFITPIARRSGAHTTGEWMELRFDKKVRVLVVITSVIAMIGITANNVISIAAIVNGMTGWPIWALNLIFFAVYMLFVVIGGMWGVTITDVFQGIIIFLAIPLIFIFLLVTYGPFAGVLDKLPNIGGSGITGATAPWLSLKYPSVLTAVILYMFALVWGSNHYWLRVSASRSERTAKWAFVAAGIICGIASLAYAVMGAYIGAFHGSELTLGGGKIPPTGTFGIFMSALPAAIAAFFLIAAIAASLSTGASTHIAGSSLIIRDVYQRFFKPKATHQEVLKFSRWVSFLFGAFCLLLCFFPGGPVYLFAFANAFLSPPAVVIVLGMFWRRATSKGVFAGALSGMVVMSIWTLLDLTNILPLTKIAGHYVIPGIILTVVVSIIVSLFTKADKASAEASGRTMPNDMEIRVLQAIRRGFNTMAEINDMLDVDSSISKEVVGFLEVQGYLERMANGGKDFYTFRLTSKGDKFLPEPSKRDHALFSDGIDETGMKVLAYMNEKQVIAAEDLMKVTGMEILAVSTMVASLIRRGYLKEGGLWKRKVEISAAGRQLLQKHGAA